MLLVCVSRCWTSSTSLRMRWGGRWGMSGWTTMWWCLCLRPTSESWGTNLYNALSHYDTVVLQDRVWYWFKCVIGHYVLITVRLYHIVLSVFRWIGNCPDIATCSPHHHVAHHTIILLSLQGPAGGAYDGGHAPSAGGEDAVVQRWAAPHGQGAGQQTAPCL